MCMIYSKNEKEKKTTKFPSCNNLNFLDNMLFIKSVLSFHYQNYSQQIDFTSYSHSEISNMYIVPTIDKKRNNQYAHTQAKTSNQLTSYDHL